MNLNDALHRISTLIHTETNHFGAQGSGFFYSRLAPGEEDRPQWRTIEDMWLVTNRHVVIPRIQDVEYAPTTLTFRLRKLGSSDVLNWEPIPLSADALDSLAKFHPDSTVDVAVINIYDILASRARGEREYVHPYFLHSGNFAGENNIEVEASSEVLVVGYPRGFYDDVNLFPIVKSGIIASRWKAGFRGRPYFLVDAKLFPGSSGSVVISKPTDLVVKEGKVMMADEKQFAFLGVYSGEHVLREAPVVVGNLTIAQTTGFDLGIVWYGELVEEIIEQGVSLSQALSGERPRMS